MDSDTEQDYDTNAPPSPTASNVDAPGFDADAGYMSEGDAPSYASGVSGAYGGDGDGPEAQSPTAMAAASSTRELVLARSGSGAYDGNTELVAFDEPEFLQQGQRFRELQNNARQLSTSVAREVEQGTAAERQALEEAIQRLQEKHDELLQREDIRQQMEQQEDYMDQLEVINFNMRRRFKKLTTIIMRDHSLTQKQKAERLEQAHKRAAFALMSDDERNMVEQLQSLLSNFANAQNLNQGDGNGEGFGNGDREGHGARVRQIVRFR